jgi:hypothetical protein
VLIGRHGLSDEAFDWLRLCSQNTNRKLRDIAGEVVAQARDETAPRCRGCSRTAATSADDRCITNSGTRCPSPMPAKGTAPMRHPSTQPASKSPHGQPEPSLRLAWRRIEDGVTCRSIAAAVDAPTVSSQLADAPVEVSRLARLCSVIDARRWVLAVINVAAAGCFVIGSVGFYWPAWYAPSVTLFLIGSLMFLLSASATALVEHRPSR